MKRELFATVSAAGTAPTDMSVVLEGPDSTGQFTITKDGQRRVVDAKLIRNGTWSIIIEGRSYVVDVDKRRSGVAVSVGDSDGNVVLEDALRRKFAATTGRTSKSSGETLRAPIAGKVVKVLVAIGDVVAPGTSVVVLEAMKMENELLAERGGTVESIAKVAGQPVDTNDILLVLR
jgi:biotin carboxyl carrier protein